MKGRDLGYTFFAEKNYRSTSPPDYFASCQPGATVKQGAHW